MVRQPQFEYPGAVYHVMARGNGGDDVFVAEDDRKSFLFRLGQVCGSHGWKVHKWGQCSRFNKFLALHPIQ